MQKLSYVFIGVSHARVCLQIIRFQLLQDLLHQVQLHQVQPLLPCEKTPELWSTIAIISINKPPNITNHRSPLERYLLDAELQVSTQAKLVQKAEDKVNQFKLAIPVIENQSPACSLCHRREAIQMLVCLYLWWTWRCGLRCISGCPMLC